MCDEKALADLRKENDRLKMEIRTLSAQLAREGKEIAEGEAKLQIAYAAAVQSLVRAIESKDPYTAGRYELVSKYAVAIGKQLGLGEEDLDRLRIGGLLMDIGKVAIDNSVLAKPEPLTPEEEKMISSHVNIGAEILDPIVYPWDISELIYQHQERWDGSGYPEALKGGEILLEARILGLCDSFVAMMAKRPYREAYSRERILQELKSEAGKKYDPAVVDAFIQVLSGPEISVVEDFDEHLFQGGRHG